MPAVGTPSDPPLGGRLRTVPRRRGLTPHFRSVSPRSQDRDRLRLLETFTGYAPPRPPLRAAQRCVSSITIWPPGRSLWGLAAPFISMNVSKRGTSSRPPHRRDDHAQSCSRRTAHHSDNARPVTVARPGKTREKIADHAGKSSTDGAAWRYHDQRNRSFSGNIIRADRDDSQRIRAELAAVIRDLLQWAYHEQTGNHRHEGGERL